ncbi:MAG: hypothetical protein U5L09_04265 [Bacteroidales bacterium]|nr:hypothetical protein [Bacteroidales bacterium]
MIQDKLDRKTIFGSILLFCLMCLSISSYTQMSNLAEQWVCKTEGQGWNQLTDITITKNGNIVGIGNFSDTTAILKSKLIGESDFYIVKLNKDGGLTWQKKVLSPGKCNVTTMDVSENGTISLAGYFSGIMKIGNSKIVSKGKESMFIAVMFENGNVSFLKKIDGQFIGEKVKVQIFKDSSLLVSSSYKEHISLADSTYKVIGSESNIFLTKFNINTGEREKIKVIKGTDEYLLEDLQVQDTLIYLSIILFW